MSSSRRSSGGSSSGSGSSDRNSGGSHGGTAFGLLLRNELRLWWRPIRNLQYFWAWVIFMLVSAAGILLLLWLGFSALRQGMAEVALPVEMIWVVVGLWPFAFVFAFSQAVRESIVILFERGDLDLLLSSPVSARAVFAVRLLTVALNVFLGFVLFLLPASILVVLVGFPELLGIYPVLISLALVAASMGMLVTLWMVKLVGAKKARSLVQYFNWMLSVVMILGFQIPNLLVSREVDLSGAWQRFQAWTAPGTTFGVDSLIWFPARAIWFDPLSVALTLGLSGAIAFFTVAALENTFVKGTQQSLTHTGSPTKRSRYQAERVWRDGFDSMMLKKEWRTMLRHPYLVSRVALQVVLVLPMTWFLLQGMEDNSFFDIERLANVGLPFLAGQLSASLTFICLSGEEAPDLLKSSPVSSRRLRRLKQAAALIPVWVILLPAFLILMWHGQVWFPALVAVIGASIGSSLLRLWNSRPVALGTMFRQQKVNKSDLFLMVSEFFAPWLWVLLGFSLYSGLVALILFTIILLGILFALSYVRAQQIGSFLYY